MPGEVLDVNYEFIVFSLQSVRVLSSVQSAAADDSAQATVEIEVHTSKIAAVRLTGRELALLDASGKVIFAAEVRPDHAFTRSDIASSALNGQQESTRRESTSRLHLVCSRIGAAIPGIRIVSDEVTSNRGPREHA